MPKKIILTVFQSLILNPNIILSGDQVSSHTKKDHVDDPISITDGIFHEKFYEFQFHGLKVVNFFFCEIQFHEEIFFFYRTFKLTLIKIFPPSFFLCQWKNATVLPRSELKGLFIYLLHRTL